MKTRISSALAATIAITLARANALAASDTPDGAAIATAAVLRISEIMPKPTDDPKPGLREGMDVNGLESGWVELENTSADEWANLADYKFTRTNRGKKTGQADYGNFPSVLIPPKGRFVFYTSERYSNSASIDESAFQTPSEGGVVPTLYGDDLGGILVWPDKVNPKKFPFVRLTHVPSAAIVDTVVIPSDVPEGYSIIVGETVDGEATKRWLCPTPTRGEQNTATDELTRLGPNAGPLYEIKGGKKHSSSSEFARPAPPAIPGTDYDITFSFNPVMSPSKAAGFRDEDLIEAITLVYRTDLDDSTVKSNRVELSTCEPDAGDWGNTYTATIPADDFPDAGHLIQWKFVATDACGNEWTSPSFNNPDDGYEWYGTIVEPAKEQMSASLPTWHMFVDSASKEQMDVDADEQDRSIVPNQARVAIYDSSTSNYYDYVRIDLRGHTSAKFSKKGHGLRFAKAHPLTMTDIVSGGTIGEIRKTSLISEFADPSFMRQMIAFWLWRKMGNLVPFDFPVRCNLNGEFYQLAFNSERFTDELIEDVYKLDKYGFGYKNVGTLNKRTTAGGTEKKTPDDEKESDLSVLHEYLEEPLMSLGANKSHANEDQKLTKFVVEKFDLPAWLNYLASARITQEMDDVWANVCAYYDNPEMKEGARGTGTWMPLGYDFNVCLGQFYVESGMTATGLSATHDWFKSHPLYGGWTVMTGSLGNNGFEAVLQSPKFRRLFLRRLRTLMDAELKEPGTAQVDTPFVAKMLELADLMRADAALDQTKWPNNNTDNSIDVWQQTTRPADIDAGVQDIWDNYVVPRRNHLYVTHSITNTAKEVGYGSDLNAGIPEAQSPLAVLAPNISIANVAPVASFVASHDISGVISDSDAYVIVNGNDETVDMSGWSLSGAVQWTLPVGTVCDAHDCIYVVSDRRAYIAAHQGELSDQVIIGNASFKGGDAITLAAADSTVIATAQVVAIADVYSIFSSTILGREKWWTWTMPDDAEIATENGVISATLAGSPILQSLGDVTTNAVLVNLWAKLPEDEEGAVIGLCDANDSESYSIYAYVNADGSFTMQYDSTKGERSETNSSKPSSVRDLSHPHLWTLAYFYNGGMKFYEDGEEIASDIGIKWTVNPNATGGRTTPLVPSGKISIGSAIDGKYPLSGIRVYGVETAAASGNSIYDAATNAYAAATVDMPSTDDIEDAAIKAAIIDNFIEYGITDETVKVNGETLSFPSSAAAIRMFGPGALSDDGVKFQIASFDVSSGTFDIEISPSIKSGTVRVMAKERLDDDWTLVIENPDDSPVSFTSDELSTYKFFQIKCSLP